MSDGESVTANSHVTRLDEPATSTREMERLGYR